MLFEELHVSWSSGYYKRSAEKLKCPFLFFFFQLFPKINVIRQATSHFGRSKHFEELCGPLLMQDHLSRVHPPSLLLPRFLFLHVCHLFPSTYSSRKLLPDSAEPWSSSEWLLQTHVWFINVTWEEQLQATTRLAVYAEIVWKKTLSFYPIFVRSISVIIYFNESSSQKNGITKTVERSKAESWKVG